MTWPFIILTLFLTAQIYLLARLHEREKWININRNLQKIYHKKPVTPPSHKYDITIINEYLQAYNDEANEPQVFMPKPNTLTIRFDGLKINLNENGTWEWQDPNNDYSD